MDNKELEQHESYGMMSFNRFDGGNGAFFGSSIKPDGGIEMTLKTGEVRHNLNHDWYRGKETIARVRMTGAQFADLITNLNMGEGVPVTLEYVHGKHMSEPPFINKRIQFEENFKQEMKEVSNQMLELTKRTEEILSRAKAPTKKEKEEILHNIAMLNQKVSSDMPFVHKSFNEQMDKTVKEAKNEIETYVNSTIHSLGMEKMSELKQLAEKNK
jgi:ElaB/YqjD/DUF883 family membrane-anchored ribosome-binding protein